MNNWHDEYNAEHRRQQIRAERNQIRLEKLALQSRVDRPGLFERTMFRFANWMISTGKQLRKRYEVPAAPCSQPPARSLAQ